MCFTPVVLAALQKLDLGAESEAEREGRSEVWWWQGRAKEQELEVNKGSSAQISPCIPVPRVAALRVQTPMSLPSPPSAPS